METVKDIMTKKVFTVKEDDNLYSIAKVMKRKNIGACVIVEDKKPIGIITERDLVHKFVARNLVAKETKAKDIMSKPVVSVKPTATIYYVNQIMTKKKFKKMPVIDNHGILVGILTQTDLINYFTSQRKKFVMESLSKTVRGSYPI